METNENHCLICLRNNVFFECNEVIFEFFGPSYKDCYQQFTQLQSNEGTCTYDEIFWIY